MAERAPPKTPEATLAEIRAANAAILSAGLSAQRAAEEASEAYQQLESLLAGLEEGVVILGSAGRQLFVNPAARRMLGIHEITDRWELPDRPGAPAHAPDGSALPAESLPVARAMRGERFTDHEVLLGPPGDRSTQHLTFSCNSILDEDGEVISILTCRDVTQLRQLEQLRDDFAALISHDLRNPLGIVMAAVERLARQGMQQTGDEMQETTGLIRESAAKMLSMVDQLVSVAALESGNLKITREPVSMLPLAQTIAQRYGTGLDAPAALPIILGDAEMIERVLENLVANAFKYSEPGSPVTIHIKERQEELVVSVSDAGRGIAPDQQGAIFERFYRVRANAAGGPKGYGLGLYTARLMVEAHGGTIWVESTPDTGSTFSFSLPLAGEGDLE